MTADQALTENHWHPATAAQQGIWILDRIERLRPAYLIPTVLRFDGPVNHELLVLSVRRALYRHPALRSVFRLNARQRRVEYGTAAGPPRVGFSDALAGGWPPGRLSKHVEELCYAPFDLAAGAPARAEVIRTGEAVTLLVLTVHHIVFDGWSRRLVVADIAALYQAALLGRDADPGPGPHPAAVLAAVSAAASAAGAGEGDLSERAAAVVERLRGAPTGVALPYDRLPADDSPLVSAIAAASFDEELTSGLLAAAAREGCTAFMAGVALLAAALARSGGQRDFLFAVVWPGRDDPATHDAVGMFMNTVVLRIGVGEDTTWRELLRRARVAAIEAFVDGDVPLASVAAALDGGRDVSRPPLTPVLINLAEVPGDFELAAGVQGSYQPLDLMYSIWDLLVFIHVNDGPGRRRIELNVDYPTQLFDHETVMSMLAGLRQGAADLVDSTEDKVLESSPAPLDLHDLDVRLETIRSVWREVLGVEDFDDDSGFFEVGGDSLLLVAMVERLSQVTGRQLRTMDLFRAGSVNGQAALLAPPAVTRPEG